MKKSAVKTKQSEGSISRELKAVLSHLSCILVGFALAQCNLFGSVAPFGVSLVAALPSGFLASGAAGAVAGYFWLGTNPIKYICAIFVVAIIRYSLSNYRRLGERVAFAPLTALLCSAVTGLSYAISANADIIGISMCISEALFAGAGAYFVDNTFRIKALRDTENMSTREISCIVVAICMVLTGLCAFQIGGISPSRVVMLWAVMACARIGRETWGSVAGVLSGLVGILSGGGAYLAGAYASAGLVGGVFSQFGALVAALMFFLTGSVVTITMSEMGEILNYIYEFAIASVLFAVTPSALWLKIEGVIQPVKDRIVSTKQSKAVAERLSSASQAVYDAACCVETVTQNVVESAPDSADEVGERVYNELCTGCGLHNFCWEQNNELSIKTFSELSEIVAADGRVTQKNAPPQFLRRCIKGEEFLQLFSALYNDFAEKGRAEKRAQEIRERIFDEFGLVARILGDVAKDYECDETPDRKSEPRVMSVMNSYSIFPSAVSCAVGHSGRLTVEVAVPEMRGRIDKFPLTKTLSEACRRSFEMPRIVTRDNLTTLIFKEKPKYRIKFGVHRIAGDDSRISGDCHRVFDSLDGKRVMMISDGMGSGGRAAVDSAMTVNIISSLTQAGMSFVCALEIANAALSSSGETEALTTVDLALIDAFSGRVEFLKAGATRSFVRHNYRSVPIEAIALPIGILGEVEFGKAQAEVCENDIVVLISDGAAVGDSKWVLDELNDYEGTDADELARHLANSAYDNTQGRRDDITVLVAMIELNL